MVFLTNVHTQTKHWHLEMITRYVSSKGWKSGKARILLKLDVKLMGALPFQFMFILWPASLPVMLRAHRWRKRFLYFAHVFWYNDITNSLIHPQFPLSLWKDDNLLLMKKRKRALLIQTVLLDIISTNLV